jgi:accessory gene regulator B
LITLMSKKLSSFFAANNIIKQEDAEVYEYSLEILFSTILNFAAVVVIAVLTRKVLPTVIYLLGFIPVRLIAGGYHADTHFRCFLVLMGTYSCFLAIIMFTPVLAVPALTLAVIIISVLMIFVLAPVADKNKPVSAEDIKSFRLKSRIAVLVYAAAALALLFLASVNTLAFSLSLGVFSVAMSLLATRIKTRSFTKQLMPEALKYKKAVIKMKNFKSAILRWSAVLASLALVLGTASVKPMCYFWFHQPKVPQGMEKFVK